DADSNEEYRQVFYSIIDGNVNHEFYIKKEDGIIYSNFSFDRELKSEYLLTVKAFSTPELVDYKVGDNTSIASVNVVISDVNDNAPVFTKKLYRKGITYKADIGYLVALVRAVDADADLNSLTTYTISSIDLYRKGYDSPDSPVRPIPSPFKVTTDGRVLTTQLMAEYPIGSRFVLNLEAREQAPPHRISQSRCYVWVYDPMKLIRVTIKSKPETVNQKLDDIESMLSNASESRAIINEIKYHFDYNKRKLNKEWSDVYVLFVNDRTYQDLIPNTVISKLDSNGLLHTEKQAAIERISLASEVTLTSIQELDVPTIVLFVLIVLIIFGLLATCVCCCCLKSWYNQKYIENAAKAAKKAKLNAMKEREMVNSVRSGYSQLTSSNVNTARKKTTKNVAADKRQQVPKSAK
ncbi:cadherin-87A-like protein, partial [Leptotrombidium deliense]